jgi:hypothetical protein
VADRCAFVIGAAYAAGVLLVKSRVDELAELKAAIRAEEATRWSSATTAAGPARPWRVWAEPTCDQIGFIMRIAGLGHQQGK